MTKKKQFLKDLEFNSSLRDNRFSYLQYYNRLTDIGINCFKWKNLPDTVDERFLELTLFEQGMAVFFFDEDLNKGSYLALQTMIGGKLSVYRIPLQREAYASNGYHKKLDQKNSVIIFNNRIHTPSKLDVEIFAKRLYNLDRTIDVNINAQKTPILLACEETQRLTVENAYMQYEGNQPVIYGGKDLDLNSIKVLNTTAPYVSDRLYDLKQQYWNEALTYLGIPNVTTTKKERLITSEVDRYMGGVYANRLSRLNARQQACDEINRMFGLNIEVEFNQDIYGELGLDEGEVNEDE